MRTIAVYTEKGGVAKTTSTVGLAGLAAAAGQRVGLVDLDPQSTLTKWLAVTPREKGLHVGAILADEDPEGWAADLAVPGGWPAPPGIEVVPSDRQLANRDRVPPGDLSEGRLRASLRGWDRDLVIIDVPNRQGGPTIANALTAATDIVIPVTLHEDGLDGLETVVQIIRRFRRSPWNPDVRIAGIVVTAIPPVMTKDNHHQDRQLAMLAEGLDVPIIGRVPLRAVVPEARSSTDWWGNYELKGAIEVNEAYGAVLNAIVGNPSERVASN